MKGSQSRRGACMMSFAQREGTEAEWGAEAEFLTLFPTFFPSSLHSAPLNRGSFLCYLYAERLTFIVLWKLQGT